MSQQAVTQQLINKRYQIIKNIKKGGMGEVILVEDTLLEKKVVMKKLSLNNFPASEHAELEKDFRREAKILATLEHIGLPRVLDFFCDQTGWYLIMDYITGTDLEDVKKTREISEKELVEWSIQILDVLNYLHNQNPIIIFRDIKPSNIMLDDKGRIKLIDFGIARKLEHEVNTKKLNNKQTAIGTVGYAPWEQYAGKAEPRSDIYALGVTMHYLLSGIEPVSFDIKPIQTSRPNIDPRLADFIMKATDSRLDVRFSSAQEMKDALEKINNPNHQIVLAQNNEPNKMVLDFLKFLDYTNRNNWLCSDLGNSIDDIRSLYLRLGTRDIALSKFKKELLENKDLLQKQANKSLWIDIRRKIAYLEEHFYKKPNKALDIYKEIYIECKEDWVYDEISRLNLEKKERCVKWKNNLRTSFWKLVNKIKNVVINPITIFLIFCYTVYYYPFQLIIVPTSRYGQYTISTRGCIWMSLVSYIIFSISLFSWIEWHKKPAKNKQNILEGHFIFSILCWMIYQIICLITIK